MYQEARRLGELVGLPGVPYQQVATLQCHSYLAATNALSLVPKDHAWLAIVAADQTDRVCHPAKVSVKTIRLTRDRQGKRRRKVAYRIPESELDPDLVSAPIDVLELSDIRKDYGLALARLQLSAEFPELERTSQFARISGFLRFITSANLAPWFFAAPDFQLDAETVVALFSQMGRIDQAFSAGRAFDCDLSALFEALTERCVALSTHESGYVPTTPTYSRRT